MFPVGLFPYPLFPPGLFPGPGKATSSPPPVLFENELANFIRSQLGINPYPSKLPQPGVTYPLLSFTGFDGDNFLLISGPCGLNYRGVQFDAWSPNFADAATVTERLYNLFKTFVGPMGRVTIANVTRHPVKFSSTPPANGQDSNTMYRSMSEYRFWFTIPR